MRLACIGGLLAVIAFAQQPDPQLWGGLDPGLHAVGYRSYFLSDTTRRYRHSARPILVALWYPAIATAAEPLRYSEYFALPPLPSHPAFVSALQAFLFDTLSDDLFRKKRAQLAPAEQAFFDALLSAPTRARRDAPPVEGKFPVVLYHSGAAGSYEDNSVLCEYLASHGYVVMTSAFQSSDGEHVSNNYGGTETSWADMAFLLAHARTLAFADPASAGAFGHSMGAQYLLEWLGRKHPPLRAAVSLDTTLEYTAEDFRGHLALRKRLARMPPPQLPVLVVASADRRPRFSTWDRYLPCRAEAAVRYFSHTDFVLHGALSRAFAHQEAHEVRGNYERLARTIRAFFDANLRRDSAAWNQLLADSGADIRVTQRACTISHHQ